MAHLLSVIFTVFIDPRLMQSQFCHNTPFGRIVHSIERSTCKEMYAVKAASIASFARREGIRSSETNLTVNRVLWVHQGIGRRTLTLTECHSSSTVLSVDEVEFVLYYIYRGTIIPFALYVLFLANHPKQLCYQYKLLSALF